MNIFEKRLAFKPFEYPDAEQFKDVMHNSFWTWRHWNYSADVQDFHVNFSEYEKGVVKRCLLAVSQIEIAVKMFWSCLGQRIPKPEIAQVGSVFGNQEVIHSDTYVKLLELLGFNDEFQNLMEVPEIKGRVNYLQKYLKQEDDSNKSFTKSLTLFSIFTENVSLFSQFLILKSFNKFRNALKDVDNAITSSRCEEECHAQFGFWLIDIIKKENPKWFNQEFYDDLYAAVKKAYKAEAAIIDWIFDGQDLPFITRDQAKEFVKERLNESVVRVGGEKVFKTDQATLDQIYWFKEELLAVNAVDFFHKKGAYATETGPVTENDLF